MRLIGVLKRQKLHLESAQALTCSEQQYEEMLIRCAARYVSAMMFKAAYHDHSPVNTQTDPFGDNLCCPDFRIVVCAVEGRTLLLQSL